MVYSHNLSNKISRDGAAKLADMLTKNHGLQGLDLSLNRIENAGAESISRALASRQNATLRL